MVRVNGHSYAAAPYDGIVPTLLGHIATNATVRTSVGGLLQERSEVVDSLGPARIGKDPNSGRPALSPRNNCPIGAVGLGLRVAAFQARGGVRVTDPRA